MRIALVSPYTLPERRGNSLQAQRLLHGLQQRGHEVMLFNSSHDDPRQAVAFAPEVIHSLHALHSRQWVEAFFLVRQLPWVVTLTGTDYNCDSVQSADAIEAFCRFDQACVPVVFHDEARRTLCVRYPDLAASVRVVPQGVALSQIAVPRHQLRQRFGLGPEAVIFFMASGIRPVKNIGLALRAFARVRAQHVSARLLLAGPRIDAEESWAVLAAGAQLDGFSYLGELDQCRVREYMACTDVFLNTSISEGMPGAVMEAMAEGLPVVATDVAGNRSLVADGCSGLLVPPNDEAAFVRALVRLAGDSDVRQRMGRHSRTQVEAAHSIEAEMQAYEGIYAQACATLSATCTGTEPCVRLEPCQ